MFRKVFDKFRNPRELLKTDTMINLRIPVSVGLMKRAVLSKSDVLIFTFRSFIVQLQDIRVTLENVRVGYSSREFKVPSNTIEEFGIQFLF